MTKRFEIVIAGGSIVGSTAACLLADAGYRVCVVEPSEQSPVPSGDVELRTYSITPACARVWRALGVWPNLDHDRVAEFRSVEVWDAGSSGCIQFSADAHDDTVLGYVIEHGNLTYALETGVRRRHAVDRRTSSVQELDFKRGSVAVRLNDGETMEADLIIAADGANSRVRELAGVSISRSDYGQHAVVCNVTTSRPHGGVARQCFLAEGPLAFLPLPDPHRCSIVWSTTPATAGWACHGDDDEFRERLGRAFEYALGSIDEAGCRRSFPLYRQHAEVYTGSGFALIGDAAHVVHPLAGQGLNLGIMDATVLAEVLAKSRGEGAGVSRNSLRRFERWRRGENVAMLSLCDGLNRLFSEPHPFIRWLRGIGLNTTDASGPLKHWLTARAIGSTGDQPALARQQKR